MARIRIPASDTQLDAAKADWRETAERQIENLVDEAHFPTLEELDQFDTNEALNLIMEAVEENAQPAVNDRGDIIEWGKVAIARIKAKAKAAKPKGEAKTKRGRPRNPTPCAQ